MGLNNFKEVLTFSTDKIKEEINNTKLWNWLNIRKQAHDTEHYNVDDIILRFQRLDQPFTFQDFIDKEECVNLFTQKYFPETMKVLSELTEGKQVGRVVIAKLGYNSKIGLHIDSGNYANTHHRYHLVVQTNDKVMFTSGDETVNMPEGTIWWVNNHIEHSVTNDGDTDRIHIIVDIKQ